jgi:hypothetical protein
VVTTFGGLDDEPDAELLQVRRVVMSNDGRFVVANGDPAVVRVFDARGRFERQLGRSGAGPGEFRGGVDVRPWTGDSVLTYSAGTRRWMLFSLGGRLIREWPVDATHPYEPRTSLGHGYYVRAWLPGSRGCPWPVAARHAATTPLTFAEALTDGEGRTWRRDFRDPTLWHVHQPDGRAVGRLRLPADIRVQQFRGPLMIAVRTDDIGADHVEVYRTTMPAVDRGGSTTCEAPDPVGTRVQSIHARNALVAGQAYHSDFGVYPTSLEQLRFILKVTEESEFTFLRADEGGWAYAVSNRATGAVCVGSAGATGLPGWEHESVACSTTGGIRQ